MQKTMSQSSSLFPSVLGHHPAKAKHVSFVLLDRSRGHLLLHLELSSHKDLRRLYQNLQHQTCYLAQAYKDVVKLQISLELTVPSIKVASVAAAAAAAASSPTTAQGTTFWRRLFRGKTNKPALSREKLETLCRILQLIVKSLPKLQELCFQKRHQKKRHDHSGCSTSGCSSSTGSPEYPYGDDKNDRMVLPLPAIQATLLQTARSATKLKRLFFRQCSIPDLLFFYYQPSAGCFGGGPLEGLGILSSRTNCRSNAAADDGQEEDGFVLTSFGLTHDRMKRQDALEFLEVHDCWWVNEAEIFQHTQDDDGDGQEHSSATPLDQFVPNFHSLNEDDDEDMSSSSTGCPSISSVSSSLQKLVITSNTTCNHQPNSSCGLQGHHLKPLLDTFTHIHLIHKKTHSLKELNLQGFCLDSADLTALCQTLLCPTLASLKRLVCAGHLYSCPSKASFAQLLGKHPTLYGVDLTVVDDEFLVDTDEGVEFLACALPEALRANARAGRNLRDVVLRQRPGQSAGSHLWIPLEVQEAWRDVVNRSPSLLENHDDNNTSSCSHVEKLGIVGSRVRYTHPTMQKELDFYLRLQKIRRRLLRQVDDSGIIPKPCFVKALASVSDSVPHLFHLLRSNPMV